MTAEAPRVADVVPSLKLRGAEVFVQQLESVLRDKYNFRLFTLYNEGNPLPVGGRHLDISRGVSQGPGRRLRAALDLRRRVTAFGPRVIHVRGGDPLRLCVLAGLHRIAPLVYVRISEVPSNLRTPLRTLSIRAAYARVSVFVAVSESLRREMVEVFGIPPERIEVIPTGRLGPPLPSSEETSTIRDEVGARPGGPLVSWVGRLSAEKNPEAALAVARHLEKLAPEATLVVVGDGPLEQTIRARAGSNVTFAGARPDAARIIAASDILLSTSAHEGLPGVVVEALLSGVPVVANDVGGIGEAITDGETGLLVPASSREALARAVVRIAHDPALRARMAEKARRSAQRFEMGTVSEEYDLLYRKLGVLASGEDQRLTHTRRPPPRTDATSEPDAKDSQPPA
ncbi:MAG: glycosyltransferase family 4 protein [Actinomycetota bacterium]